MFLGERLSIKELIAFCFLVSGGIFLSLLVTKTEYGNFWQSRKIRLVEVFIPVIGAALTSAIYFVITKSVLSNIGFINGLIWTRLGTVLGALLLLIPSSFRQMIFKKGEAIKPRALGLFALARTLGVASGFLIYWAIFLGSVTLVNSLQGVQYLFLLLLAFLLFKKIPQLKEQLERGVLVQKIIAIILIGVGLAILII
jgi:drug/metabolite transporter (DMT)-like permease